MHKLNTYQFIEKASIIHRSKYDYSLVNYINNKVKVKIICPIHGVFEQKPNHHLSGSGCNICNGTFKKSTTQFISQSNKIHNNKYDYSLVQYINNETKVKIICSIHGVFEQIPTSHLKGYGCSKCKSSKGEISIRNWLQSNDIKFQEQKRFIDCRDKLPLPFDFYLPDYNMCIEYDGEQHFKPFSFGSDKSKQTQLLNFNIVKQRDLIKTNFCLNQNIFLVRIPYFKKDDIENILNVLITRADRR